MSARRSRIQSSSKSKISKSTHFISRACSPQLCNSTIQPAQSEFDSLDSTLLSIFSLVKLRYFEEPASKRLASVRKELFIELILGLQSFELKEALLGIEKFKRAASNQLGSVIEVDEAQQQFDTILKRSQSLFNKLLRPEKVREDGRPLCVCELANMQSVIEERVKVEQANLEYDTSFLSPTTWINHFEILIETGEVSGRKWTGLWRKKLSQFLLDFGPILSTIYEKCFNVAELEKWCSTAEGLGGLEVLRMIEFYDSALVIPYHDYLKVLVKAESKPIISNRYELLAAKQFEAENYSNSYRMYSIACNSSLEAIPRIECAISRMELNDPWHYTLAILDLTFALEISETTQILELRGRALGKLDFWSLAIRDFERALEMDDSLAGVKRDLNQAKKKVDLMNLINSS